MSYYIKIDDMNRNICGIYKLNYPNGKIYIGQSVDIKRRMWEHNNTNRSNTHICHPCDAAINKYGPFKEIEILEECPIEKLNEREIYWISYYNSTDRKIGYNINEGGHLNSVHKKLTDEQVYNIRKRRYNGERKCNVFKDYADKISFHGFEGIWLGHGYPTIGEEFLIPANLISRQEYSSKANKGSNNNKAKLDEDKVRDIRQMYTEGKSYKEIHSKYSIVTLGTIKRICNGYTWKHVK